MATPFSGKDGGIQLYNDGSQDQTITEINVTNWSASITDSAPGTAHSNSSGWVDSFLGVKAWSASIDCLLDGAQGIQYLPSIDDAVGGLQLDDGENWYSATGGVVSNASYSCDVAGGGLVAASLSVSGSGALTIAPHA